MRPMLTWIGAGAASGPAAAAAAAAVGAAPLGAVAARRVDTARDVVGTARGVAVGACGGTGGAAARRAPRAGVTFAVSTAGRGGSEPVPGPCSRALAAVAVGRAPEGSPVDA